ncbi:leucine--tRNA ligase [Candidatus Beckwithbacteria bacterium CG2_30_44_31]|uniref:Leucine--tRNA ligase n=1 Tax=Candidatus Beckwithbacteria bacterium CG2_30_44_31 TaxID=1805035 RepID=A0A1J5AWR8_9BACT|nr:MAG: leucine--tRNA ligase [Candidatus Beckwithbacteria bacterium CG2_30_44_31]
MSFDHQTIEKKWAKKWQESGLYQVDLNNPKRKFYNLMMFPYPSAEGLHVGNMYAFTGADVYGRFKAMQGYEVFEPIGLDGFGIHSENYAISINKHPAEQAKISEKHFYEQLSRIGNRFSWNNRLETYDPKYYCWTQWLFVQMFKHGLAYRKKALVNWCPSCKTVLADEQVEAGLCERCKTPAEKRENEQWFFKITEYAQRLLDNIEKINWPEKIKIAQRNWIGRKEGINITYKVVRTEPTEPTRTVTVFTTRPDTNFGATFIVLGPEHKLAQGLAKKDKEIQEYIDKALKKSEIERIAEGRKKTGVFTGLYAINDLTGKEMPIYVTDFVLGNVGTGAVVGVPGHDKRDFEFAKEFGLEVIRVVAGEDGDTSEITKIEQVQEEEGKMINSGFLNGMEIHEATEKIMDYFEEKGMGKRVVTFRLRDWCISRQRYWGPPIPMINCPKCGWVAEKEENLPIKLPYLKNFKPTDDGKPPLERAEKSWLYTKCPKCGGEAKRETEVSDTFLDSSWYFLRYPSVDTDKVHPCHSNKDGPFDPEITRAWLPVDAYIGGAEHAVLHLMYSRFVWMALQDWGYIPKSTPESKNIPLRSVSWEEPFPFLYGHGLIIKDGAKMSKSRGNIVNPDEYIEKYGADALRLYLMFIGPYDQGGDFRDTGMKGMKRFLNRVWKLVSDKVGPCQQTKSDLNTLRHRTVKKLTEAMVNFRFNVGIAHLMTYVNGMSKVKGQMSKEDLKTLILLLAPFAPYISEELWSRLKAEDPRFGKPIPGEKWSVHQQTWPKFEARLATNALTTFVVQINGKLRAKLELDLKTAQDKAKVLILAKANNHIKTYIKDKKIVKEIFVAGKLVNLVVK